MSLKLCIVTESKEIKKYFSKFFDVYYTIEDVDSYEVIVLVSYSKLISKEKRKNKIYLNVHNSLLPKYRGLHAFTWAIINGESRLGYTLHKVNDIIDGGDIISQVEFDVSIDENINDVFKKANVILQKWLVPLLLNLKFDDIKNAKIQDESQATYVTKRKEKDNLINWNQSSDNIHNFIRALTPPYTKGAFTFLNEKKIYMYESENIKIPNYIEVVGKVVNIKNNNLIVKTLDNAILIKKYNVDSVELKIGSIFSNGYKK